LIDYYKLFIVALNSSGIVWPMDKWIALVKANMKARKVTQHQLAARLGMSQGGIGHWLGKRRVPSLADMNRVLEELGLGYLETVLVIREKSDAPANDDAASVTQYNPYFRYPVTDWKHPCQVHEQRPAYGATRFEASDYEADGEAFWLQVTRRCDDRAQWAVSIAAGHDDPGGPGYRGRARQMVVGPMGARAAARLPFAVDRGKRPALPQTAQPDLSQSPV
jgi:transcriptional regulator with XRE-family HTH domain